MDLDDEELEATRRLHGAIKGKIEIGEYVRTKFGNIGKFYRPASENPDVYCIYIRADGLKISTRYDSILKHSKNIIDLIEEGDYVNGEPVEKIETGLDWGREITTTTEYLTNNEDINSVITKEQIKQIEYRIKE